MGDVTLASLIGSWKLVSVQFRFADTGEVINEPLEGFCTFDTKGRWTVVVIPTGLGTPTNDRERAAIFNRMIAFSGRCQFNGGQIIVKVDVAWYPAFSGMDFTRLVSLSGDRLIITQPEWEHPFFKGRRTVVIVSWDRDR